MSDELHLVHGDARELIPAYIKEPVHCVVTDPPFGVSHIMKYNQTPEGMRLRRKIENDEDPEVAICTFLDVMEELVPRLADDADIYIFTSWKVVHHWIEVAEAIYPGVVRLENMLVWEKGWPGLGDLKHNWPFSYELILYCKKGNRKIKARRSSILSFDRVNGPRMIHPTEKPVALLQELIVQSTEPGELVVDPFAGSGSTLEAARRCGRRSIGFELDDEHFDRASKRLTRQTLSM